MRLDALAAQLPELMRRTPKETHADTFAAIAAEIMLVTALENRNHVRSRLEYFQREVGILPCDHSPAK